MPRPNSPSIFLNFWGQRRHVNVLGPDTNYLSKTELHIKRSGLRGIYLSSPISEYPFKMNSKQTKWKNKNIRPLGALQPVDLRKYKRKQGKSVSKLSDPFLEGVRAQQIDEIERCSRQ